jgi:hypothetical protein
MEVLRLTIQWIFRIIIYIILPFFLIAATLWHFSEKGVVYFWNWIWAFKRVR